MNLSEEQTHKLGARARARQASSDAETQVAEFRELRAHVNEHVSPISPSPIDARQPHLDALRSVRAAIDAEWSTERSLQEESSRKRAQIQANDKRRLQVIGGFIVLAVVLILVLVLAVL